MSPHQRARLRDYEIPATEARFGFFGGDWLAALLLFEALDNDYMYVGDPSPFDAGGDWGGGDGVGATSAVGTGVAVAISAEGVSSNPVR